MGRASSQAFPTRKDVPIQRIISPFHTFLRYEASSGIVLMIAIVTALIWANLSSDSYYDTWKTYFTISFGNFTLSKPIDLWINDLLMAIFFLLVGLEVKRELLIGELREVKKAMLPIGAAIGGIVIPSTIYLLFNFNDPDSINGWAIPAATDIAFALGVLYLLGNRVPIAARVFLATLAIIDDIAAILIIAIFYTGTVKFQFIALAIAMFFVLLVLNFLHVRRILPYILVGSILWYGFFASGIHATIAGVFLALTIPSTVRIDHIEFKQKSLKLFQELAELTSDKEVIPEDLPIYMDTIASLEHSCQEVEAPLQRLEHTLAPWVAFIIMPIFTLANAGVIISGDIGSQIFDPISLGIIFGLLLGKPIGILTASYLAVKLNIAKLPPGLSWKKVLGIGFLAGIGFTMSTFIGSLAFENDQALLEISKIAILVASFLAGGIGYFILREE
ncbi:MAG: Na+/H+ antiporter NhaA [Candidatus Kariarchaeaceae archaeon]|jgi:NhaA family Na+:H+ antiporter